MELRVLEYFLAVAREQSITRAADFLHLTQPTLSRQLKDLETEFGKQLLIRGKRKVTLTQEGQYFRKKAEEIVSLAQRTEAEMRRSSLSPAGDIYIGAGETQAIHHIARAAAQMRRGCPGLRFHFVSGDTADLAERLDKGLFDFCLLIGENEVDRCEVLALPYRDRWGVLMPKDSALARKTGIAPQDLWDRPLILSRQSMDEPQLQRWLQRPITELEIAATYNLATSAAMMASEGIGYVVTLEGLIHTEGTNLCFRPFDPPLTVGMALVWKKYRLLSPAADAFLQALKDHLGGL